MITCCSSCGRDTVSESGYCARCISTGRYFHWNKVAEEERGVFVWEASSDGYKKGTRSSKESNQHFKKMQVIYNN